MDLSYTVDVNTLGLGNLPTGAEAVAKRLRRRQGMVARELVGKRVHPDVARMTHAATGPDVQAAALRYAGLAGTAKAKPKGVPTTTKGKPEWEFKPDPKTGTIKFKTNVNAMSQRGQLNVNIAAAQNATKAKQIAKSKGAGLVGANVRQAVSNDVEFQRAKAAAAQAGIDPNLIVKERKSSIVKKTVLPVAGAVVGTFIAPGVGTAIGGAIGSSLSKVSQGQKLGIGDALGIAAPAIGSGVGSALSSTIGTTAAGAGSAAVKAVSSGGGGFDWGKLATSAVKSLTGYGDNPASASMLGASGFGNLFGGNIGNLSSITNLFDGIDSLSEVTNAAGTVMNLFGKGKNIWDGVQGLFNQGGGGNPAPATPPPQTVRQAGSGNGMVIALAVGGGLLALMAMSGKRR